MMPRDMDLIRELMLRFEQGDQSLPEGRSQEQVAYHVEQMHDAGLIKAITSRKAVRGTRIPHFYRVQDITPAGHDFIAALREATFWAKLKKHLQEKAVPVTVDIVAHAAKQLAKDML